MGRLMACNDETDGGRDKRDVHVRGHYSSAAHTKTVNATHGCRTSRLSPTSLFLSPPFLSFSHSSHPPPAPLLSRLQPVSLEIRIVHIKSHHSPQTVKLVFYHLRFEWSSSAQDITGRYIIRSWWNFLYQCFLQRSSQSGLIHTVFWLTTWHRVDFFFFLATHSHTHLMVVMSQTRWWTLPHLRGCHILSSFALL